MRKISKTIMMNRLSRLPERATVKQVHDTLKLDRSVLTRWQQDQEFKSAGVVAYGLWDREKLTAWILAVMKLSETKNYRPVRSNPSVTMNPKSAAEFLGIPVGYKPSSVVRKIRKGNQ